jgi:hypothetical protein
MSDHFHLTLIWDSSAAYYPNNTTARYVTKLPGRSDLDGDHDIGLSKIVYHNSWHNADNKDQKYWIAAFYFWKNEHLAMVMIKSGYYEDANAFVSSLTHQAMRALADIPDMSVKFTFVEHVGRIRMQAHN